MSLLFDAHSHLDQNPGPPDLVRVVCGTCEGDWEAVLAHASSERLVLPMLGLHPWRLADAAPGWLLRLEALLQDHRAGVGECGLDFARKDSDRGAQIAAFRQQLRLARALDRPVAMHVVRAWGPLLDLLREEGIPPAGALVHAFSGSPEVARSLQTMGVFLSFSGALLRPGRAPLGQALRAVHPERLLLETDGQGELAKVIAGAAEFLGGTPEDLAAQTWENGQRCFKELLA